MISPEEAWDIVLAHVSPLPIVEKTTPEALQHVLAEPVLADRDNPSADLSAMDGYAVRANDTTPLPAVLRLVGEVPAGSANRPSIAPGECARIFTGANVPPGADAVVMQEDTRTASGDGAKTNMVEILRSAPEGLNIRRRGENARKGDKVIAGGTLLSPTHIGICASVGRTSLKVHKKPRVSILATGREIKDATDEVAPHEIRDANGPMIEALLAADHMPFAARSTVPDNFDAMLTAFRALLQKSDVLVVSGGVSVGDYDLVPEVAEKAGGTIRFHKVSMKPGKPQLFATLGGDKYVFGLPGNPLSVMTGYQEFVLPSLKLLSGQAPDHCRRSIQLPLAADVKAKGKRDNYLLAALVRCNGQLMAEPIRSTGSADLIAGGKANGTVILPAGQHHLPAGSVIEFRPWGEMP